MTDRLDDQQMLELLSAATPVEKFAMWSMMADCCGDPVLREQARAHADYWRMVAEAAGPEDAPPWLRDMVADLVGGPGSGEVH